MDEVATPGVGPRLALGQLLLWSSMLSVVALGLLLASGEPSALAAVALAGALAGAWLSVRLHFQLRASVELLRQLARGAPGSPGEVLEATVLSELSGPIVALRRWRDEQERRHAEVDGYRDQLLDQVGKTAAQEERNRLARELHDSIKQQLFGIGISVATAQARWEHDLPGAWQALEDARRSVHEAQVEMKALLQQLRPAPLEAVGLVEALRDQCEALGYRTGAEVRAEFGALPGEELLPPGAQETLFRAAQEALANIARHARAGRVLLRLGLEDGALCLRAEDDGQGFDPDAMPTGMGMANLRERAASLHGTLELRSAPGAGTTIVLRVPLAEPAPRRKELGMSLESADLRRARQWVWRGQWLAGWSLLLALVPAVALAFMTGEVATRLRMELARDTITAAEAAGARAALRPVVQVGGGLIALCLVVTGAGYVLARRCWSRCPSWLPA